MITLVTLAAALVAAALLVGLAVAAGKHRTLVGTEQQEVWLVAHAPERLRRSMRFVDRRVAGGIAAALAFLVVLIGAMLVGWLVDSVDGNTGFARWDRSAAQWGADHATLARTTVLDIVTAFGSTIVLVIVLGAVGLFAVRRRGWGPVGYLTLVGGGVMLLNNGLKLLVGRDRPNIDRLVTAAGSSFPSGHSAAAAACWAAIALVASRRWKQRGRSLAFAAAAAIAVLVATSRVLLGVHWLTDVIAGVAVGWTWFLLCTLLFGGRLLRFAEPVERLAATASATASGSASASHPATTR